MLRAILNKSWQQHPTRHQLYGHLPPITKTIQVRRTRHAGHCWRSRDELIRDVLLWIPTHGRAKAGRPARTYIQQLCEDTGCCPEDLPRAMNDREEWRERVWDIRATSAIWWWWQISLEKRLFNKKNKNIDKNDNGIVKLKYNDGNFHSYPWQQILMNKIKIKLGTKNPALTEEIRVVTRSLSVSSSSCRAGSTDIPDPLSPLLPIVHRPR